MCSALGQDVLFDLALYKFGIFIYLFYLHAATAPKRGQTSSILQCHAVPPRTTFLSDSCQTKTAPCGTSRELP